VDAIGCEQPPALQWHARSAGRSRRRSICTRTREALAPGTQGPFVAVLAGRTSTSGAAPSCSFSGLSRSSPTAASDVRMQCRWEVGLRMRVATASNKPGM
jgi:hypothetical protein